MIEIKKTTSREKRDYDVRKLMAFKGELHYTFAAFVLLETGAGKAAIRELEYIENKLT